MNNMKAKVKINYDSIERIAQLPYVGIKIAAKILSMRSNNIYFRSPRDLAKISELSAKHAEILKDLIDWSAPLPKNEDENLGSVGILIYIIFALLIIATLSYYLVNYSLESFLSASRDSSPSLLAQILNYGRAVSDIIFRLLGLLGVVGVSISIFVSKNYTAFFEKVLYHFTICIAFLGVLWLLNLFHVIFYLAGFPIKDPFSQGVHFDIITEFLVLISWSMILVLFFYPEKITDGKILLVFDFAVLLNVMLMFLSRFSFYNRLSASDIRLSVLNFLLSIFVIYFSANGLRYGKSISENIYFVGVDRLYNNQNKLQDFWTTWLNKRLPDEEQQKALRDALNNTYPASHLKTFTNYLFIILGGWLLVTSAEAIISYFIQHILIQYFP